jgi:hypothetical protein
MFLYIRALSQLFRFQYYVRREGFVSLHRKVRESATSKPASSSEVIECACRAMDVVCTWYPRRVLCLQRSAATTCLLRSLGVPARMVIGIQQLPFKAHAWVEVDGHIVNDKSYTREIFTVLDYY